MSVLQTTCSNAFRKKTMGSHSMQSGLKKCLNLGDLTLLSIGAMIGGGVYVLTGTVAHDFAGPSVVVSYAVAALASTLSAFCYAEFGSRVPIAGSAYQFTYFTIGEIWAFMIGWNVLIEHIVLVGTIAKVWSANVDTLFGNVIQSYLIKHCPLTGGEIVSAYPDLLAAGVVLLTVGILLTGVKLSAAVNAFFAALNLAVISVIVGVGFYLGSTDNWFKVEGGFFPYGFSGTMTGAASLVYSYIGYEVVACAVEESNNPKRDIPLSLVISVAIVVIAYVCASAALTLMVPYNEIDTGAPFPQAFERYGFQWAKYLVAVGVIVASYAPMIAMQYVAPRYLMAMARDGLLCPVFARVHDKTKVPFVSTIVSGAISIIVATFFELKILVEFLAIGQLLACCFVATCVIKLRYEPNNIKYERILDDLDNGTPASITNSVTNQPTENTPLRRLPESNQPVTTTDTNANVDKDEIVQPQNNQPVDVATGALKQCVIDSSFGNNALMQSIARRSHGTVPKWILAVAMTTGFIATVIGFFGDVGTHVAAAVGLAIFAFLSILSLSSLLLFQQDTSIKSFRVPFVPYLPFSAVIVNILLIMSLQPATWLRLVVWLALGFIIYCFYGYKHSMEGSNR